MTCTISIVGEYARVTCDSREGGMSLDMSASYCRLFESTKTQVRDYMESICRWCGAKPDNTESLIRGLLLHLSTVRRNIGMRR